MATRVVIPSEIYYNDSTGEEQMLDVDFIASVEEDRDERGDFISVEDITWEKEGFTPEENEAIELELERLYKFVVDKAYAAYERMKKDKEPPHFEEIRRMQELAGIQKEMRVGPEGSLMSDEEAVNKAFEGTTNSLSKMINALHKNPSYTRAKWALDLWKLGICRKLGIEPEDAPILDRHIAFTGRYPANQAIPMIKKLFVDILSGEIDDEEQLTEDDYTEDPSGIDSGDTDSMGIAEDDFSSTMRAVEDDPVV